eukprot:scaffold170473_cov29-Tisochrysis_lutea.AAC.2
MPSSSDEEVLAPATAPATESPAAGALAAACLGADGGVKGDATSRSPEAVAAPDASELPIQGAKATAYSTNGQRAAGSPSTHAELRVTSGGQ